MNFILDFKILRFLNLIIFLFFKSYNFSQSPNFKNFTVENNLPSSECYQVLQDKKGFIWVASDKGVAKFNGYQFENYTLEDGLPENCIIRMYEDPTGRIWFAGLSGKLAYHKNNRIKSLKINDEIAKKMKGGLVSSMTYYKNTLWLGTYGTNQSFRISFKNGNPKLIVSKKKKGSSAYLMKFSNNSFIYSWSNDINNINTPNFNLNYLTNNKYFIYKKIFTQPSILNYNVRCTSLDKRYFLFAFTNQLFKINKSNGSIKSKYLVDQQVLFLFSDSKKGLWVGTRKGGLLYYSDGKIGKTKPQILLKNKSISCITEDREGGFWITSLEDGLFYLNDINYKHITDISSNRVNCITSTRSTLFAGLDNGNMVTYNGLLLKEINLNNNPVNANSIRKIAINNDKSIVVCGTSGIALITNKINWCRKNNGYIPCISFIKNKNDHTFWIVGAMAILHCKLLDDNYYRIAFPTKSYSISQDKKGDLWIGTIEGLYSFDGNNIHYHGKKSKLLSKRINDLEIKKETIWMATKEYGVCIKKGNSVYHIGTKNGLPSNICQSLTLESDKIGWIATNKGVCKIKIVNWNPLKIESRTYNSQNGLISNEINEIDKNGSKVYIASNKGITWFDENKVKINKASPPIYIEKILINKKDFPVKNNYSLSYDKNNISINYIGLAYKNEGKIEYKYRLIGLDTSWNHTQNTIAPFTTLPYGDYTFEVAAKNNDGFWSDVPATVQFSISPPFWHTWSFRILGSLSLLGGIYWFLRYRIKIVENRANETARLYQQTVEMEMKFLSSQMNPHFTFNAMNSIQLYMMENEPEKAQKYLVKYSRLMRKVLENNMKKVVKFEDEIEMLTLYMDIESMRFKIQFDHEIKGLDLIKELKISIPPMIIQPYIENAIWHGLSNNRNNKGKIILSFEVIADKIKCTIEDNGVGRTKAKTIKSANTNKQSLGMFITQKRLRQLQLESVIEKETNIIDIIDENGIGYGTRVEIYLPFVKNDEINTEKII